LYRIKVIIGFEAMTLIYEISVFLLKNIPCMHAIITWFSCHEWNKKMVKRKNGYNRRKLKDMMQIINYNLRNIDNGVI